MKKKRSFKSVFLYSENPAGSMRFSDLQTTSVEGNITPNSTGVKQIENKTKNSEAGDLSISQYILDDMWISPSAE